MLALPSVACSGGFSCEDWCNEWTCGQNECRLCGPDNGCTWSPPPPPFYPGRCGRRFEECTWSQCCANEHEDACTRRSGRGFHQCRPKTAACGGDSTWDCPELDSEPPVAPTPHPPPSPPSPPPCSSNYEPCWSGNEGERETCCSSTADSPFGCFRKTGTSLATCRPMAADSACFDGDVWLCPGWNKLPPAIPSPAPPPSPPPPPPPSPPPCKEIYQPCWDAGAQTPECCASPRMTVASCESLGACAA